MFLILLQDSGLMDGRTDGRSDGRSDGRTVGRSVGRRDGQTDGRMDGRTDGRTDGRSDGNRKVLLKLFRQQYVKNLPQACFFNILKHIFPWWRCWRQRQVFVSNLSETSGLGRMV